MMQKGAKHTEETKLKISKSRAGKFKGVENNKWKGEKVGYGALHDWIRRYYGKATHCENNTNHTSTRFHWANISGKYLRQITDWKQLCPSCHQKMDWVPNKTCRNGHLLKEVGILLDNRGSRICKECKRNNAKQNYKRHKRQIIERVNRWRKQKRTIKR